MRLSRFLGIAVLVAAALAFAGYRAYLWRSAARARQDLSQDREDLRHLMQSRVHEEYTRLSFTVWHDQPLTPAKMDAIAVASARIAGVAKELEAYEALYGQQGWNREDIGIFERQRLQLFQVAERLTSAARLHDETQVVDSFRHLDDACQGCHQRFRRDLAWK